MDTKQPIAGKSRTHSSGTGTWAEQKDNLLNAYRHHPWKFEVMGKWVVDLMQFARQAINCTIHNTPSHKYEHTGQMVVLRSYLSGLSAHLRRARGGSWNKHVAPKSKFSEIMEKQNEKIMNLFSIIHLYGSDWFNWIQAGNLTADCQSYDDFETCWTVNRIDTHQEIQLTCRVKILF